MDLFYSHRIEMDRKTLSNRIFRRMDLYICRLKIFMFFFFFFCQYTFVFLKKIISNIITKTNTTTGTQLSDKGRNQEGLEGQRARSAPHMHTHIIGQKAEPRKWALVVGFSHAPTLLDRGQNQARQGRGDARSTHINIGQRMDPGRTKVSEAFSKSNPTLPCPWALEQEQKALHFSARPSVAPSRRA